MVKVTHASYTYSTHYVCFIKEKGSQAVNFVWRSILGVDAKGLLVEMTCGLSLTELSGHETGVSDILNDRLRFTRPVIISRILHGIQWFLYKHMFNNSLSLEDGFDT